MRTIHVALAYLYLIKFMFVFCQTENGVDINNQAHADYLLCNLIFCHDLYHQLTVEQKAKMIALHNCELSTCSQVINLENYTREAYCECKSQCIDIMIEEQLLEDQELQAINCSLECIEWDPNDDQEALEHENENEDQNITEKEVSPQSDDDINIVDEENMDQSVEEEFFENQSDNGDSGLNETSYEEDEEIEGQNVENYQLHEDDDQLSNDDQLKDEEEAVDEVIQETEDSNFQDDQVNGQNNTFEEQSTSKGKNAKKKATYSVIILVIACITFISAIVLLRHFNYKKKARPSKLVLSEDNKSNTKPRVKPAVHHRKLQTYGGSEQIVLSQPIQSPSKSFSYEKSEFSNELITLEPEEDQVSIKQIISSQKCQYRVLSKEEVQFERYFNFQVVSKSQYDYFDELVPSDIKSLKHISVQVEAKTNKSRNNSSVQFMIFEGKQEIFSQDIQNFAYDYSTQTIQIDGEQFNESIERNNLRLIVRISSQLKEIFEINYCIIKLQCEFM